MPLIQLHSLTNLSPPLISLATLSSFPPGEAKAAAPLGSPSWRPLQGVCKISIWNKGTRPDTGENIINSSPFDSLNMIGKEQTIMRKFSLRGGGDYFRLGIAELARMKISMLAANTGYFIVLSVFPALLLLVPVPTLQS